MMKWSVLALGASLLMVVKVQAALIVGDVAIVGVNTDNPDEFAWVALRDLAPGQQLTFSDSGWINGRFGGASGDGGLQYVAPQQGVASGTLQVVRLNSLPTEYTPVGGALGTRFSLSPTGDQLVVFAGPVGTPRFLYAANLASTTWQLTGSSSDAIRSQLYPGLVNGVTAVGLGAGPLAGDENDNARYQGIIRGARHELLSALSNASNWSRRGQSGSSDRFADLTNGVSRFEVIPEPGSAVIWLVGMLAAFRHTLRVGRRREKAGTG